MKFLLIIVICCVCTGDKILAESSDYIKITKNEPRTSTSASGNNSIPLITSSVTCTKLSNQYHDQHREFDSGGLKFSNLKNNSHEAGIGRVYYFLDNPVIHEAVSKSFCEEIIPNKVVYNETQYIHEGLFEAIPIQKDIAIDVLRKLNSTCLDSIRKQIKQHRCRLFNSDFFKAIDLISNSSYAVNAHNNSEAKSVKCCLNLTVTCSQGADSFKIVLSYDIQTCVKSVDDRFIVVKDARVTSVTLSMIAALMFVYLVIKSAAKVATGLLYKPSNTWADSAAKQRARKYSEDGERISLMCSVTDLQA